MVMISFLFGSLIGSFLNVCIFRLPEGSFWAQARSHCRSCGVMIPAWQNIPILSYLALRGKASCCREPLSLQYPVVEVITGLFFGALCAKFPCVRWADGQLLVLGGYNGVRWLHGALFLSVLLTASAIDLRHMIIPDELSLGLVVSTPLVVWLHPELTWRSGLYGVLLGGGVIYGIAWVYYLLRRTEGMGMGDAKLLAGIGGWLGVEGVLPTLFYGSVLGSVWGILMLLRSEDKSFRREIPFGPFLAVGAILFYFLPAHWRLWS